MNAATATFDGTAIAVPGRLRRVFAFAKDLTIGTLLCTNPVTGILVLGWLMRRMRWIEGLDHRPTWLFGRGPSLAGRLAGGLVANLAGGLSAAFTLALATLPFTALWTLAWWAGWENSFNKGYEQAPVGPLLSLAAIAISLPILSLVPMAMAHQAVEGQWRAFFAWRHVRKLIARATWRYMCLIVLIAALAAPVMLFRMASLFIEAIVPGYAGLTPDEAEGVHGMIKLVFAAWVFVALWAARSLAARCYRAAAARLEAQPAPLLLRLVAWTVMLAACFAIVAQVYIGQFFNHGWTKWLSHPFFLLPWAY